MKKKNKWIKKGPKFVAMIDIMGFKDMILRNNPIEINKKLITIQETFYQSQKLYDPNIKGTFFSDTILLITNNDQNQNLYCLISTLSRIYAVASDLNIPFKGAISYGNITADFTKSIFFGQPIIDAYEISNQLYYYGIVLDHNAQKKINDLNDERISNQFVVCKTPFKNGKIQHSNFDFRKSDEYKNIDYNNYYNTVSGNIRMYVDNTIDMISMFKDNNGNNELIPKIIKK